LGNARRLSQAGHEQRYADINIMKRTCQILLLFIVVSLIIVWIANLIPLTTSLYGAYAVIIGAIIGLLASAVGIVIGIIFLARKNCRARGLVYPLLTVVSSTLFITFIIILPTLRVLKMKSRELNLVYPGTKVILFDQDSPTSGVTILDTQARKSKQSGLTGTCTIKNLTVDLKLANHITIQKSGERVTITAYSVHADTIPFYVNLGSEENEGVPYFDTSSSTAPTSDLIRINGELMSLGTAADRFTRIPTLEQEK
jgi:hypothetical protein